MSDSSSYICNIVSNQENIVTSKKTPVLLRFTSVVLAMCFLFGVCSISWANTSFDLTSIDDVSEYSENDSHTPFDSAPSFPLENSEDEEFPEDSESPEESNLEPTYDDSFFSHPASSSSLICEADEIVKMRYNCAAKSLKTRSTRSLVLLLHSWKIPHS